MSDTGYNIRWLGYCEHNDKLWGWFRAPGSGDDGRFGERDSYCFWAVRGKTISMNKHRIWSPHSMDRMVDAKIKNGYASIKLEDALAMWPTMMEDMQHRFLFLRLSDVI